MELRDSVRFMQRATPDLSFEECEAWMRELGYVDNDEADWRRLLRDAGIRTGEVSSYLANLRMRWGRGGSPKVRSDIRAALEEKERGRAEPTPTGMRVLGMDEWNRIGMMLSRRPQVFAEQIERLRPIADSIELALEAQKRNEEAQANVEKAIRDTFSSAWAAEKQARRR